MGQLRRGLHVACALVASFLAASVAVVPEATAVPTYAARTGFTCVTCHFDPNGGGPRKDIGFLFARQRHDLTPDPDERWQPLMRLTNNLGDVFYFGTNTRALYLYEDPEAFAGTEKDETSTFFQMQSAVYTTLRPHRNLALVWNLDFNEFGGSQTRDAYGLIDGLPGGLYLRAGRFRVPFGLRHDDHTGATRGGFLAPETGSFGGALPYDPRGATTGLELGAAPGEWFGALAVMNTGIGLSPNNQVHAVAVKWGVNRAPVQLAVSGYDAFRSAGGQRSTRWGGYGLYGWRDLTVKGEFVGGEERRRERGAPDRIQRLWAVFGEADYRVSRWFLVTARYDFIDADRDRNDRAAERFGGEAVFTVVPFADLRVAYRRLVPETAGDENQYLAMWHFYY